MPISEKEWNELKASEQYGMYCEIVKELKHMKMQIVEIQTLLNAHDARLRNVEAKN